MGAAAVNCAPIVEAKLFPETRLQPGSKVSRLRAGKRCAIDVRPVPHQNLKGPGAELKIDP